MLCGLLFVTCTLAAYLPSISVKKTTESATTTGTGPATRWFASVEPNSAGNLSWRLQAGRVGPIVDMGGCLGLTDFPERQISLWAGGKYLNSLPLIIREGAQPFP